jgi:hypothetical protein
MSGGTVTELNASCLAVKTVIATVKGRFKNVVFLLCALKYGLLHNILHTNEALGAFGYCVLWDLLCDKFCILEVG